MEQTIYSDEKRTATWKPGIVKIFSHVAKKELPLIMMSKLICDNKIQSASLDALKKSGYNPTEYMALCRFGKSDIVAPINVAETIYKKANRLEKDYRSECDRIANLPQNKERREVSALFAKADKIERSDSDDNVWLPASLRAKARQKLEEWREKYPEAAKKEDAEKLLYKADDLRSKAVGALVYDADGWISQEEQQKRHDDFIKEAEAMEEKARAMGVTR